MEVPVNAGGRLRLQVQGEDLPGGLELAGLRPGDVAARVGESLEDALEQVKPTVRALLDWMMSLGSDEVAMDFGLTLGAETGLAIAKGTSEVHFTVNLTWRRPPSPTTSPDNPGTPGTPDAS
jgi:Trypsin-co-occurring domain 1